MYLSSAARGHTSHIPLSSAPHYPLTNGPGRPARIYIPLDTHTHTHGRAYPGEGYKCVFFFPKAVASFPPTTDKTYIIFNAFRKFRTRENKRQGFDDTNKRAPPRQSVHNSFVAFFCICFIIFHCRNSSPVDTIRRIRPKYNLFYGSQCTPLLTQCCYNVLDLSTRHLNFSRFGWVCCIIPICIFVQLSAFFVQT